MMAQEIQIEMIKSGINKKQLAERCGWSQSNLYNKMKRDNFTESELRMIAAALNMGLEIKFVSYNENV